VSSWANISRKAQIFTHARPEFFSGTKPLILLVEMAVKYSDVKYVFLTDAQKTGLFRGTLMNFSLETLHLGAAWAGDPSNGQRKRSHIMSLKVDYKNQID
jgi:hypothetical protein